MGSVGNKGNNNTVEEKFTYTRSPELKEWSDAEEKRSAEMSQWVNDKIRTGGFSEFYEESVVEDVASETIKVPGWGEEEVTVSKMNITYVQNWDENDKRVKQGKAVTGSTYYIVQDENGAINENHFAYKTKADAIHAMKLYADEMKQYRNWFNNRKG